MDKFFFKKCPLNWGNFNCRFHGEETPLLTQSDWPSLQELLQQVTPEEASHSSLKVNRVPTVGTFEHGVLVSAASYEVLSEKVAHIGFLTHPIFRGKGLAKKSISAITEIALDSGLGIQYQTLYSNVASVRAAEKIGFRKFAEKIAVRIKA